MQDVIDMDSSTLESLFDCIELRLFDFETFETLFFKNGKNAGIDFEKVREKIRILIHRFNLNEAVRYSREFVKKNCTVLHPFNDEFRRILQGRDMVDFLEHSKIGMPPLGLVSEKGNNATSVDADPQTNTDALALSDQTSAAISELILDKGTCLLAIIYLANFCTSKTGVNLFRRICLCHNAQLHYWIWLPDPPIPNRHFPKNWQYRLSMVLSLSVPSTVYTFSG